MFNLFTSLQKKTTKKQGIILYNDKELCQHLKFTKTHLLTFLLQQWEHEVRKTSHTVLYLISDRGDEQEHDQPALCKRRLSFQVVQSVNSFNTRWFYRTQICSHSEGRRWGNLTPSYTASLRILTWTIAIISLSNVIMGVTVTLTGSRKKKIQMMNETILDFSSKASSVSYLSGQWYYK